METTEQPHTHYLTTIPLIHPTKVFICEIREPKVLDQYFHPKFGWITVVERGEIKRGEGINSKTAKYSVCGYDNHGCVILNEDNTQARFYDELIGGNSHLLPVAELKEEYVSRYVIGEYFLQKPKLTQQQFDDMGNIQIIQN